MTIGAGQPFVVRLSPSLARRLIDYLESPNCDFHNMNELAAVAFENLLTIALPEKSSDLRVTDPTAPVSDELLRQPVSATPVELRPATILDKPLFVLTNRLNPIPVALRVLLNLTLQAGDAPKLSEFLQTSSRVARSVGLALLAKDLSTNTDLRRSTGWPVGTDLAKTLERFTSSFLIVKSRSTPSGPLLQLGLVSLDGGRTYLTELGKRLAMTPSPLLNELRNGGEALLSDTQQALLRDAVSSCPGERAAVIFFFSALERSGGAQSGIDRRMRLHYKTRSANLVNAQRAAMVGRLRDLGVLETVGRGASTRIDLTKDGARWAENLPRGRDHS